MTRRRVGLRTWSLRRPEVQVDALNGEHSAGAKAASVPWDVCYRLPVPSNSILVRVPAGRKPVVAYVSCARDSLAVYQRDGMSFYIGTTSTPQM